MLGSVVPVKLSQISSFFGVGVRFDRSAVAVMALVVFCSALFQVAIKNNNRQKFLYLQQQIKQHDSLIVERDRLLLEKSRLLAQHRLQQIASNKLNMVVPTNVVVLSDGA